MPDLSNLPAEVKECLRDMISLAEYLDSDYESEEQVVAFTERMRLDDTGRKSFVAQIKDRHAAVVAAVQENEQAASVLGESPANHTPPPAAYTETQRADCNYAAMVDAEKRAVQAEARVKEVESDSRKLTDEICDVVNKNEALLAQLAKPEPAPQPRCQNCGSPESKPQPAEDAVDWAYKFMRDMRYSHWGRDKIEKYCDKNPHPDTIRCQQLQAELDSLRGEKKDAARKAVDELRRNNERNCGLFSTHTWAARVIDTIEAAIGGPGK